MQEIFSIRNIVIYFFVINIVTILAMYIDKCKAKKSKRRIAEKTLFTLAFIGGSIGGIIGMYTFRHKTQKPAFVVGFPMILILQVLIIIVIVL